MQIYLLYNNNTNESNDDIRANNFDKEQTDNCRMNQKLMCFGFQMK